MPRPIADEATALETAAALRNAVAQAGRKLLAAQDAEQVAQIEYDTAKAALADAKAKGQ